MARRNLLHRTKLGKFQAWLEKEYGKVMKSPCGSFEVMRWKSGKAGEAMCIIFDGKSKEHYSCNEASVPYIKKFLKQP
ncbi:hypothetical protein HOU79_gp10 [Vibrio phage 1.224.A._10N.261.48.B1]|uniref:Uncharacterized protein n=1 Tax=Vibrio phage 1.224.A._10N.261.48.B1 TaxID=1881226 RepID=A0A2I7RRX0_9CAUD|nr:hypothetical protein HOU79_gp10 [Vibrio phage 1.224.A._10N.261.48.B1]AUR96377.1 hypothetical protein NVP1224A_10 [Vibrio phage 1.224.A._10N.261.48.B1]